MTDAPHGKRRRGWIIGATLALIALLGEVAIEVLSDDLKEMLRPYRIYVWSALGLAFIAAIVMAFRESRASDDSSRHDSRGERNISASEVKDSTFFTGDQNVIADRTQGDVVRRDKITARDVFHGDQHIHIEQAGSPAPSALHQLPSPPRDFTGRREEIEELLREMENGVTISGLRGLGDLLSYSLIEYEEETGRYRLHDLARIFADGRSSASERDLAKRRHAAHYCRVLKQADEVYQHGGFTVTGGLALLDKERKNIEAGWEWAAAGAERDEQATRLCMDYPNAGAYVLDLRQHPRERIRWAEVNLEASRRLKNRSSEGNALGNLGVAYTHLGQPHKAIEYHKQDLAIARETGDRRGEGNALGNLGNAYGELGEARKAIEYYGQQLAIARETGNRKSEGNALGNLGNAHSVLG